MVIKFCFSGALTTLTFNDPNKTLDERRDIDSTFGSKILCV